VFPWRLPHEIRHIVAIPNQYGLISVRMFVLSFCFFFFVSLFLGLSFDIEDTGSSYDEDGCFGLLVAGQPYVNLWGGMTDHKKKS